MLELFIVLKEERFYAENNAKEFNKIIKTIYFFGKRISNIVKIEIC
jgi:hypothetical protein